MQIDHLVPESLENDPERLAEVVQMLGLPKTFDVNSFENWLPICAPHNLEKGAIVFEPSELIQMRLQKLALKAGRARKAAERLTSNPKIAEAAAVLEAEVSRLGLDPMILAPALEAISEARAREMEEIEAANVLEVRIGDAALSVAAALATSTLVALLSTNLPLTVVAGMATLAVGGTAATGLRWPFRRRPVDKSPIVFSQELTFTYQEAQKIIKQAKKAQNRGES
jgi:hypothetical protein